MHIYLHRSTNLHIQVSPTSETSTAQFEDARSLQSPGAGSFFSTSPAEGGASPARFHPLAGGN